MAKQLGKAVVESSNLRLIWSDRPAADPTHINLICTVLFTFPSSRMIPYQVSHVMSDGAMAYPALRSTEDCKIDTIASGRILVAPTSSAFSNARRQFEIDALPRTIK